MIILVWGLEKENACCHEQGGPKVARRKQGAPKVARREQAGPKVARREQGGQKVANREQAGPKASRREQVGPTRRKRHSGAGPGLACLASTTATKEQQLVEVCRSGRWKGFFLLALVEYLVERQFVISRQVITEMI